MEAAAKTMCLAALIHLSSLSWTAAAVIYTAADATVHLGHVSATFLAALLATAALTTP